MATAKSPMAAPPPAASPLLTTVAPAPASSTSPYANSSPSSASGPSLSRTSSHHSASYFPHQQPQLTSWQQQPAVAPAPDQDPVTLANTLANSQIASPAAFPAEAVFVAPAPTRPTKFTEEWDASQRGSSIIDGSAPTTPAGASTTHGIMQRSNSFSGSTAGESQLLSRGNTLKKKPSLRRSGSLRRSSSRRSMKAGSVRSLALQSSTDQDEIHSAFYCPVPTTGNPTEALANRFQAWRKILKDLIAYFREIQAHYEHRSKSLLKLANVSNNTATPAGFLASGGLDDALPILRTYNKQAVLEANKAREIEEDVILALTGLRSDLHQKIKEIKNLSGDFKNSVEKEMENTRRAVKTLQEILGQTEVDSASATGKQDPYLLRLGVDRQLERQIDEENYLHQAYLNLENSGRELESIIVGEIQKSYNAYAGILKREADAAYTAIEELRVGPIAMPKDHEWAAFVQKDDQFVDPDIQIRSADLIHYPGRDHYACQEIRAGLLERKSKYLRSYTAGWYVLSPTHLHEFKSADKTQAPVMSLYLPEQKLGSHSSEGGSSNKFILKGRQTGGMHRGHTWVFRAESHDTMMAWYEDIKALTEKTPQERSDFVRGHSRSFSRSSQRSFSSDGVVDEDDDEPFAADTSVSQRPKQDVLPRRPSPGGRFPSDLQVNAERGLQAPPLSPSSVSSGFNEHPDRDLIAAAGALPGSSFIQHPVGSGHDPQLGYGSTSRTPMEEAPSHAATVGKDARQDGVNPYTNEPLRRQSSTNTASSLAAAGAATGLYRTASGSQNQRHTISNERSSGIETGAPRPLETGRDISSGGEEIPAAAGGTYLEEAAGGARDMKMTAGLNANATNQQESQVWPRVMSDSVARQNQNKAPGLHSEKPTRPTEGTTRTDSVPTISNLHIPGQYP